MTTEALLKSRERKMSNTAPASGRGGRTFIVLMLIGSLIISALTRSWAEHLRLSAKTVAGDPVAQPAEQRASNLPSFALALLLGGLRGPLVMILWTSSESQKT